MIESSMANNCIFPQRPAAQISVQPAVQKAVKRSWPAVRSTVRIGTIKRLSSRAPLLVACQISGWHFVSEPSHGLHCLLSHRPFQCSNHVSNHLRDIES